MMGIVVLETTRRRSWGALLAATGLVLLLCGALGTGAARAADPSYSVFVGYADNVRSGTTQSPTPWEGAAGVTFEGCSPDSSCAFDAGAIRVANATALTETVDSVTVDFDGCVYDIWPHGVTLAAGGQIILTQTASGSGNGCTAGSGPALMDSSDIGPGGAPWANNCHQSGVIPLVTVTVNGVATTYQDTGQVLNTSGVDAADCARTGFPPGNETTQWVSIGSPPCPQGAVLTLAPPSQSDLIGSTATVNANFSACSSPLQGAAVTFVVVSGPNLGRSGTAVADAAGNASFSYSSALAGTDTIQASVTNLAGTITSNPVDVVWERRPTTLAYDGARTSDFNDQATLSATLTDTTSGAPIPGAPVSFTLNGAESCTALTDTAGRASCPVTPGEPAGSYTIDATYAGDPSHLPSSTSVAFAVTHEEAALSSSADLLLFAQGGKAALSSTLTDPVGGAPIAGTPVTMTLGGGASAQSCTATTDATGTAACSINPVTVALGPEPITDSFAGDAFYQPASNAERALVFAYTTGGSFVVGDRSATGAVAFWGAQWAKANSLSGGGAPPSFKGFEDTPPAPGCGVAWTTDPGNSTPPPPGPLPSYIAVVVASRIDKSGPTIAGDTRHVVIVHTDPGYASNPGHAGTGTVVATLC